MAKRRTAKQKAATKKLVAFNKARGSLNKKRSKSTKKSKSSSTRMRSGSKVAKKKQSRRKQAKGILGGIVKKQTADKILKGAGAASLAVAAITVLSPQNARNPIVPLAAGFIADQSIEGVIGAALSNPRTIQMIRGTVSQFSGGMGGGNQMMMMQGGNGGA